MIALPWLLMAVGIVIVIFGFLWASLPGTIDRRGLHIDADMRDDEIVRELKEFERMPASSFVIIAGLLCILAGVCWRIVRMVL